jgi:hypothetical protein
MTKYDEVVQALLSAGYLTDADLDAAAVILADALVVDEVEEIEAAAIEDYSAQEDLTAEAEVWASEDALEGDLATAEVDEEIIVDAVIQQEIDKEVVLEAEAVIAAAYTDAAAALLAAELIDEANAEAVAAMIADLWVVEED